MKKHVTHDSILSKAMLLFLIRPVISWPIYKIVLVLIYLHNVTGNYKTAFEFIPDFTAFRESKHVVLHMSRQVPNIFYKSLHATIMRQDNYLSIFNSENLQCNISLHDTDLHFAFIDKDFIQPIISCLNNRIHRNKEAWVLFSQGTNFSFIQEKLSKAKLDLDDEIFIAQYENNKIKLSEIYKISPLSNVQSNFVGNWTPEGKLQYTHSPKWYRRMNLKV